MFKNLKGSKKHQDTRKVFLLMADHGLVGRHILPGLVTRKLLDVYAGVSDPHRFDIEGVTAVKTDIDDQRALLKVFKSLKSDRIIVVVPSNRPDWAERALEAADANKHVKFVVLISLVLAPLRETFFGGNYDDMEAAAKHFFPFGHCIVRLPLLYDATIPLCAPSIRETRSYKDARDPDMPFRCIALSDVAKAVTQIMLRPNHHSEKTYHLVGPSLTLNEQTAAFKKVLKKKIKLEQEDYEQYEETLEDALVPEWTISGTFEIYRLIDDGCEVTNRVDDGDYEKITGEKPLTFRQWVQENIEHFE